MKRFAAVLIAALSAFAACAENETGGGRLFNAESYNGLAFAGEEKAVNEPLEIPVKTKAEPGEETPKTAEPPEPGKETPKTAEPPEPEPPVPETSESETPVPETSESETSEPETSVLEPSPPPEISVSPSAYGALNYDEVVGVWISYIELSGILTGKSEARFRQSYGKMMDDCRSIGINTVYVHLRPFGDALYKSGYYPWSKYASGEVGVEPGFDPLEVMLEETHKRGISFHGWLNPMRINSAADIEKVSEGYPTGKWYGDDEKRDKYIVRSGDYWYLNPAYGEVVELIGNGAAEIAANYDVDGIHIDDYFYPVTDSGFDSAAFNASSFASLEGFRLYNCNNMVKTLYSATKKGNPSALFGISPQGSIENNYNLMYADVEKWCKSTGFADYIAPQVYFGFENSAQPYVRCINQWQEMANGSDVKLIAGLAVYKIGKADVWAGAGSEEWLNSEQILKRQIEAAKKLENYGGAAFYSYNYLFNPAHLTPAIKAEIEAFKPIIRGNP
ncbi:MAG: family 10 glycosylhydrolase [Oscillospiraceae bacterium]|jgi:uncharacterized lipoprotein YddW (UPF0748 family)|nr:family 10 glycosylhydrolase [Oscillospiraceae bacterium]